MRHKHNIQGKTREQVVSLMGDNYISEYGGDVWAYVIDKTWWKKERVLIIEFDYKGIAINVSQEKVEP